MAANGGAAVTRGRGALGDPAPGREQDPTTILTLLAI
jgi:hypothetical protein